MKRNRLIPSIAIGALLLAGTVVSASNATAATPTTTLVVNAGSVLRTVTHVGSGGLYALATPTTPTPSQLPPLGLNQLVQPAPGVQQLGNGASTPTGDALKVAGVATNAGAQEYVRMPDIYPDFPYKWVSWTDWTSKVNTMVNARLAATGTTNINGWELWNEPDWTWNTASAGSFDAGWARTYKAVRALDTITPVVGPSTSVYDTTFMTNFLTDAKASGTLPQVICWHELDQSWTQIQTHVTAYRALEKKLGIGPLPIAIDEYAPTNYVDVPSASLHWIAEFEDTGVSTASRAYWYESGTVNGLLFNNRPTGTYWLYKWYGDMAGNMVTVTPSGYQDGIASYDSTRKLVNVVFGGQAGNNAITVQGLSGFGSSAKVTMNYAPNSGRLANVAAPTVLSTATYAITNGSISVPVNNQDSVGAYQLVITPAAGPTTSYQEVYEAENATVVNAARELSSTASQGGYVGHIDNTGDERSDSFVDFRVNVPTAGAYNMAIRYANGGTATSTQGLSYNGGAWSTVSYPVTGSWGAFTSTHVVNASVTLKAGYNMIRLAKGSPGFAGGANYAELDSITLTH